MSALNSFWLVALGAVIGLMTSVIGIGGGVVMVPLLPHIQSMPVREAVATSLFSILLVSLRNTYGFHQRGLIPWRTTPPILIGAAVFAVATGWFASAASDFQLKLFFGLALLSVLFFSLFRSPLTKVQSDDEQVVSSSWRAFLIGAICGVLSAGSGLGAGLVASPLILRFKLARSKEAIPIVNAMMIVNAAMGTIGYLMRGFEIREGRVGPVWIFIAGMIFLGSQLASPYGIRNQHKIPAHWRFRLLMTLLVIVVGRVWWEILHLWNASNT